MSRRLYAQRVADEWWTPTDCATAADAAGWFADDAEVDEGHEIEVIEAEEGDANEETGVELVRARHMGIFRVVKAGDGDAEAVVEEVVRGK